MILPGLRRYSSDNLTSATGLETTIDVAINGWFLVKPFTGSENFATGTSTDFATGTALALLGAEDASGTDSPLGFGGATINSAFATVFWLGWTGNRFGLCWGDNSFGLSWRNRTWNSRRLSNRRWFRRSLWARNTWWTIRFWWWPGSRTSTRSKNVEQSLWDWTSFRTNHNSSRHTKIPNRRWITNTGLCPTLWNVQTCSTLSAACFWARLPPLVVSNQQWTFLAYRPDSHHSYLRHPIRIHQASKVRKF